MNDSERIKEWATASYRRPVRQKTAIKRFEKYLNWTKLSPSELIKEQRDSPDERSGQRRVLRFYNHLKKEAGKTDITAFDYTKFIRSFYNFYGVTLNFRPSELETPVPKKKDFPLELHHIQGMVHAANLRGKALVLTMESSGLRVGDVVKLRRSEVEPLLNLDEAPVGLEVFTEKERTPAYTFLHKSAILAIKKYLASRTDSYPWLFPTDNGKHLSIEESNRIVVTAFKKAGFNSGSLRIRNHCLRKFVVGRLQDAGVETNIWKTVVGKAVPESAYSSEKLRESYMKALPRLDPDALVNNHARVKDLETKVENLVKRNSELELQLQKLVNKKGIEAIMDLYKQIQSEVNREAFSKSVEARAHINGKQVKPKPIKVDASEVLALKAWARTLQKLYSEGLKEEV